MTDVGKSASTRLLYVTMPNEASAHVIGQALVEARLAACVNIFPVIGTIYRWEDKIEHASETAMIVKTSNPDGARAAIMEQHPYETPAVVALAVDAEASNPAFIDWIATNSI